MKIENLEKVVKNAEKLTEKSSSSKVFLKSLKILKPNKRNFLRKMIMGLIEVLIAVIMANRQNTVELTETVFQIIITVVMALFAVVFTGYAFFQALINDKLLISMVVAGDNEKNKLSESNIYFAEIMIFQIMCLLLDLFIVIFAIILPKDWVLFSNALFNEILAMVGISFLLHCNIEGIWEMKSFIFNIFQFFNLHAYSRIAIFQKEKLDQKDES